MRALSAGLVQHRPQRDGGRALVVGLVNNMPDGALETTERQFSELLRAAARQFSVGVSLRIFSIPEVPRGETGRAYIEERCEDVSALWQSDLDGLIVTGMEPKAPTLEDEPYWGTLARIVDWAREHTASAVWSCLAAHAAVYHLDAIERRPFGEKLLGVFECAKAADHALLASMPGTWHIPHSRYNDLPAAALTASGYCVLARSPQAGADAFVKNGESLFLFFQGHPEYDARTLLREYRRDVRRFLSGERETYPQMPRDYFDPETTEILRGFQSRAMYRRVESIFSEFPDAEGTLRPPYPWHDSAVRLYTNWLAHLVANRRLPRPAIGVQPLP